jgi:putative ABC transport system ATP-binding protein
MGNVIIEAHNLKRYYRRGVRSSRRLMVWIYPFAVVRSSRFWGHPAREKRHLSTCSPVWTRQQDGTLSVAGKSVVGLKEDELVEIRRGILGFVFQQFSLIPTLTVTDNVELPLMFLNRLPDRKRTYEILRAVGLADRATHLPRELSGGQMQRVAIARALIVGPRILVADEPTGNLDSTTGAAIITLFKRLASEEGLAILLTTHNATFGY